MTQLTSSAESTRCADVQVQHQVQSTHVSQHSRPGRLLALLMATILLAATTSLNAADDTAEEVALLSVLALNYATVSLTKIVTYNDLIVLDQEYSNIINNVNLSMIHDEEIIELFTTLMDTLTLVKIQDKYRQFAREEYEAEVRRAIYSSINSSAANVIQNTTSALRLGPQAAAAVALASLGSNALSYQDRIRTLKGKGERTEWEIDVLILQDLNHIRKEFFKTAWQLIRRHSFPDKLRLTEEQVEQFVDTLKDEDIERRSRRLERLTEGFLAYPPFWYYRGVVAQRLGEREKAKEFYQEFESVWRGIFRRDHFLNSVNMNKIVLMEEEVRMNGKLPYLLEDILKNSRDEDWNGILFVALQYIQMHETEKAIECLQKNIDNGYEVSLHNRFKAVALAESERDDDFYRLIDQMVDDVNVKNQDILFLFGRESDLMILEKMRGQIENINLSLKMNRFTADDLVLSLPEKWAYKGLDVILTIGNRKEFPKSITGSAKDRTLVMTFAGVLNVSTIIQAGESIRISIDLQHDAMPVTVAFSADVVAEKKEVSRAEKWARERIGQGISETRDMMKLEITMIRVTIGEKDYRVENGRILIRERR